MAKHKSLPAGRLKKEAWDLIYDYASSQRISMSEALRRICANSPELKAFAESDDLSELFALENEWGGGKRPRKE